jgi:hypothetical protein
MHEKITKDAIFFKNGSVIHFMPVTICECCIRGRSANMLVFEDEEYFRRLRGEKFDNLRRSLIPVVSSNKDGILIS